MKLNKFCRSIDSVYLCTAQPSIIIIEWVGCWILESMDKRFSYHYLICASLFQGFRGRSKNCYSIAIRRVHKALQYQYVSRRLKKREMRSVSSNKETKRYMLIVNLMSLCRYSMWIITFRLHTAICWPVQHCILLTEKSIKYVTVDYSLSIFSFG